MESRKANPTPNFGLAARRLERVIATPPPPISILRVSPVPQPPATQLATVPSTQPKWGDDTDSDEESGDDSSTSEEAEMSKGEDTMALLENTDDFTRSPEDSMDDESNLSDESTSTARSYVSWAQVVKN